MLGIEPRTSYMQSMRSTTELHTHLMRVFSAFVDLKNTINPVVGIYQDISEIILHESHRTVLGDAGDWTQDLIHASMRSTTELQPLLRKVLSASVGFQNPLFKIYRTDL